MKYAVVCQYVESQYCDEMETMCVVTISRDAEDGTDPVNGDCWLLAGVRPQDQGSAKACGSQSGFLGVWVPDLGGWQAWTSFDRPEDQDEVAAMVDEILDTARVTCLATHRQRMAELDEEAAR